LAVLDAEKPLEAAHGAMFWLKKGRGLGCSSWTGTELVDVFFEYAELSCE
jgi:hypothetical protein